MSNYLINRLELGSGDYPEWNESRTSGHAGRWDHSAIARGEMEDVRSIAISQTVGNFIRSLVCTQRSRL